MLDPSEPKTTGGKHESLAKRREHAAASFKHNCGHREFADLFPEFTDASKVGPNGHFSLSEAWTAAASKQAVDGDVAKEVQKQQIRRRQEAEDHRAQNRSSRLRRSFTCSALVPSRVFLQSSLRTFLQEMGLVSGPEKLAWSLRNMVVGLRMSHQHVTSENVASDYLQRQ